MKVSMQIDEYQRAALSTAIYPRYDNPELLHPYVVLGLVGEAGEVAEKAKKVIRDQGGLLNEESARQIALELGDVLWYAAAVATEIGYTLGDVARLNLAKLADRKERAVLGGSGDAR